MSYCINRAVSISSLPSPGGQAGVDRGALEAALKKGFPYGGLPPKGRLAEDGIVPKKFDKMQIASRNDYLFGTEWNVTHSDCTLIIFRYCYEPSKQKETLEGGSARTEKFCRVHGRPSLAIFTADLQRVFDWLNVVSKKLGKEDLVLNVAGPRESKSPRIYLRTKTFVTRLIQELVTPENPNFIREGKEA